VPRTFHRERCDIHDDDLIPKGVHGEGDSKFDPMGGKRRFAIIEVLCCLPEEQYVKWKEIFARGQTNWFIPHFGLWGRAATLAKRTTIYLSPILEFVRSDDAVVGLVVHEMAHVLLGHPDEEGAAAVKEEHERQANQAMKDWGFGDEADAMGALWSFFQSAPPSLQQA
jgi:hypothetical protein